MLSFIWGLGIVLAPYKLDSFSKLVEYFLVFKRVWINILVVDCFGRFTG